MPKFDIHVNAPPEAVFSAISDLTRHGAWSAHKISVEAVGEGPPKVGSEYLSGHEGKAKDRVTVTELSPNERFGFHVVMPNRIELQHAMTVMAQEGGALVSHQVNLSKLPGPMVLFKPMLVLLVAVAAGGPDKKFLKSMKGEMEGGGE